MGFEYELAKAFADHLNVELKLVVPGWQNMFKALNKGKGDLIAANLTVTPARETMADFSDEYMGIQQLIITHKDNHKIKGVQDLNGTTIHVRKRTSCHERLLELKEDGMDIELALHENIPTEELLRQVAEKEIEVTVAASNIALLNRRYYPDIRMAFPIEEKESLGWAVKKGDGKLLRKINEFFDAISENGVFGNIYEKYYGNVHLFDYVDLKKFHKRIETRLPRYEKIIREEAAKYGFDWRLIAAVIYQESHFNPRARSYKGVRGLMQLTLNTAQELGIQNRLDPAASVRGGVKYLNRMYKRFKNVRGFDRILFALASYNIGYGHVKDAQKIAQEKGLHRHCWSSIKQTLPLLQERRYYKKTRYGYGRGMEAVRYVNGVLTYYDILKRKHDSL
jgi:membrane-bound lytic murein transglycosylase F